MSDFRLFSCSWSAFFPLLAQEIFFIKWRGSFILIMRSSVLITHTYLSNLITIKWWMLLQLTIMSPNLNSWKPWPGKMAAHFRRILAFSFILNCCGGFSPYIFNTSVNTTMQSKWIKCYYNIKGMLKCGWMNVVHSLPYSYHVFFSSVHVLFTAFQWSTVSFCQLHL